MKKITATLLIATLLSMASALAQSGTTGPLTWAIVDSTLTISGEGEMPDYIDYGDLEYSTPWYYYLYKTVVIENGVTSIGNYAFCCSHMVSITIPTSVTRIGIDAFRASCLTSITIPNSVTSIGKGAFESCSLTSINIPHGVTRIEDDTFFLCVRLNSVTIPNSITSIGNSAFQHCVDITSIIIPNSVTHFANHAFENCLRLTSFTNLNPVPASISSTVFQYVDQSICTLKVPMESVLSYQNANVWKNFNIVGINVGIKDTVNYSFLQIYPNPTTGELSVVSYQLSVDNVEVFDIYGRKQKIIINYQLSIINSLNISHLPTGIYFLRIQTEIGVVTRKVVKY